MCDHLWTFRDGRSYCGACGAWSLDLICWPELRQNGGHYPTATDVQRQFACGICYANILTRMVDGELRVVCRNGHDIGDTQDIITKAARDYRLLKQEADAVEVLDGLPPELRALVQ